MPEPELAPDLRRPRWKLRETWLYRTLLGLIVFYALCVRLSGAGMGLPYLHHWDEPQIAGRALLMLRTGDLNPHYYQYPSALTYACLGVDLLEYYRLMGSEDGPGAMKHVDEIRTGWDDGWAWSVSHPEFYLWDRALVALFGALTVLLTALIARSLAGRWAGLLAGAVLAVVPVHVELSAVVAADVPTAFCVILSLWAALRFHRTRRRADLAIASAAAGLAAAFKYNAVFAVLIPLAAVWVWRRRLRPMGGDPVVTAGMVLLIPVAAFFACNPCIPGDFRNFVIQSGTEVHHYKVEGHGEAFSVEPGLPNIARQFGRMRDNLPLPFLVLAGLGAVLILRRPRYAAVLWGFPLVYGLFMAGQKADFHRNFVVFYPYAAIAAGCAAGWLARRLPGWAALRRVPRIDTPTGAVLLRAIVPGLAVIALLPGLVREGLWARGAARQRETRTVAVERINRIVEAEHDGLLRIGIARELRFHPRDLAVLSVPYELHDQADLWTACPTCNLIVATRFQSVDPAFRKEDERLNQKLPASALVETISGPPARRDVYSIHPVVLIYRNPAKRIIAVPLQSLRGRSIALGDGTIFLPWETRMESPVFRVPAGEYAVEVTARGTPAKGRAPRLVVWWDGRRLGEIEPGPEFGTGRVECIVPSDGRARLALQFDNDAVDREKKEDRNLWIREVRILRVKP